MKRILGLAFVSALFLNAATGCSSYSEDRDVFKSTYMSPKSVYVVYKPSNETAWSYDVPPQHILVVERDAEDSSMAWATQPKSYPTTLMWELYPITASESILQNGHYLGSPIESGVVELNGTPLVIGSTVGSAIDPSTVPTDRDIEDIEQDLDDLPEPDAAEEAAE
ncbi:MAG: hypothetical protein ACPGYV_04040 [Phycisphaeraceae bacterium]